MREVKAADGMLNLVGDTPLVHLHRINRPRGVSVWVKLEGTNPGGSAKDRTAAALFSDAYRRGELDDVDTIIESSSGNLGVALARQALLSDVGFICVADPRMNPLTLRTMRALGAKVDVVPLPDPDTGDWLAARKHRVFELLEENPRSMSFDQYSNRAAFDAHTHTMREIVEALGEAPDIVLVAMSTTGTIGSCIQYVRSIEADTVVIGIDAEGSVLYGGQRGERFLPGFGAGVAPELSSHVKPDRVVRVSERDSVIGARVLARSEGVLAGASGGAVFAALAQLLPTLSSQAKVVAILHDLGPSYLETVYDDQWVHAHLGLSPRQLNDLVHLGMEAFR